MIVLGVRVGRRHAKDVYCLRHFGQVLKDARAALDGSRQEILKFFGRGPVDVPVCDFLLEVSLGRSEPVAVLITISARERVEVTLE